MHPIAVTSNAIVIVFVHAFPFLIHKSFNLRENKFYYYYYYLQFIGLINWIDGLMDWLVG